MFSLNYKVRKIYKITNRTNVEACSLYKNGLILSGFFISHIAKFERFVMGRSTLLIWVKQYRNIILLYFMQAVDGAAK